VNGRGEVNNLIEQKTEPQECAWNGDEKKGEPSCTVLIVDKKTYNQKYCCSEHCRKATNQNIMLGYYARKDRKNGKKRECKTCPSVLSRYNDTDTCESCRKRAERLRNERAKTLFADVFA